jgi:hypothetical protein
MSLQQELDIQDLSPELISKKIVLFTGAMVTHDTQATEARPERAFFMRKPA